MLNAILTRKTSSGFLWVPTGAGAHDALDALVVGIDSGKVNFISDADIRSFFDEVSQEWLIRFVEHRTPGLDPGADKRSSA